MPDADDSPRRIDATPGESRGADGRYGHSFLKRAGHLGEPVREEATSLDGYRVAYLSSVEGPVRLGYFECRLSELPADLPGRIARRLGRRTRLQYVWFFDPERRRVRAFRTTRGSARFSYDPTRHTGAAAERKRERLDRVGDEVDALFDAAPVVDRFARDLGGHRLALARALEPRSTGELTDRERLLAAQRVLDRVVVLYFLLERGVVVAVDERGETVPGNATGTFETLVGECEDVWGTLEAVFDRLNGRESGEVAITASRSLHVPGLDVGLFGPGDLGTVEGDRVDEATQPAVAGFDWRGLVDDFDRYDWRLDRLAPGDGGDATDALTPAVLGHVYERFVVAVSEAGDDVRLDDLGADARDDLLAPGNGEVGAYYTDEAVTDFAVRRALWEALREKIDADRERGRAPAELDDLYRPGAEQRAGVEADQRDGFDVLYADHGDDRAVLAYVDAKLRELTVCDPAVGSGAFALAVANALFEWRSMCVPERDAYAIRRQIVAENVFGVDVLEGAAERCRLRLRLWTVGAAPVDSRPGLPVEDRRPVPTLPDVGVRTGNSLIGFAGTDALASERAGGDRGGTVATLREFGERVAASRTVETDGDADRRDLQARYAQLKRELDERYAAAQRDPEANAPTIADRVDDGAAARRSIEAGSASTTFSVEVPDGIPDSVETALDDLGFTTYTYKARLDDPSIDEADLERLFERLRRHFDDPDAWRAFVEREYVGRDFDASGLDAVHWPLAFPRALLDDGGFDVVVGNPPYGASVSPEAEPLVGSERNYECQGAADSCEWFYERALDLVHDRGVVAYLVSKSVAFYSSWSEIREKLLSETAFKHVFDVGLGFAGVNLETVAIVQTVGGDVRESTPTVHRSRDGRRPTSNRPVHLGWVDQRFMRDAGTILFRPIDDAESDVLDQIRARDRRLGDAMSAADTSRQLYVPDREKARLDEGDDAFVDANPWVRSYHLEAVRHVDLSDYREAVEAYAVPRVMLKVLRGSRLRAWLDPAGEVVGTEKLVNVPLEDSDPSEIAFVYAALNHPCVSFYLQKAVFSETTETARVMDGDYSTPIPIPAPPTDVRDGIAQLAWTLTLATQLDYDSERDLSAEVGRLRAALEASVAGLYLEGHDDRLRSWTADLQARGPPHAEVRRTFERFYTARFATRDGRPEVHWDDVESLAAATAGVAATWETDAVLESKAMRVLEDVL